jgi:hypothetical protein
MNQQEIWQVEVQGQIYEANFEELTVWIAEGALLREDKVRRGNLRWLEAGKIPALYGFFRRRARANRSLFAFARHRGSKFLGSKFRSGGDRDDLVRAGARDRCARFPADGALYRPEFSKFRGARIGYVQSAPGRSAPIHLRHLPESLLQNLSEVIRRQREDLSDLRLDVQAAGRIPLQAAARRPVSFGFV